MGTPAMLWAIPIEKGFRVAAAKPVATPTNTMAPPTIISYPRAAAIPANTGTMP